MISNKEIARILRNVAVCYELTEENPFKIIAYNKAADEIENLNIEAYDLWREGKLKKVPGVGPSIHSHLEEIFKKGKSKHFEEVFSKVPASIFPILELQGVGPKKAYKLVTELHLTNPETAVDDLKKAADEGKIAPLKTFGETSQKDILEAIGFYKRRKGSMQRMPLPYAYKTAQTLMDYLKEIPEVEKIETTGSLRRMVSTIGDIDIAVATRNPEKVVKHFVNYSGKLKLIEQGPSGASIILNNGKQVDLRVCLPQTFGSMLQYFTGSKNHNIHLREYALKKGLSLSEYGIKPLKKLQSFKDPKLQRYNRKLGLYEFQEEKDFYEALGMEWITPELREDRGEIIASINHKLPRLVTIKDIKGDLQIHSSYNLEPSHDLGKNSMEEIAQRAKELDYEYVAYTDHNPGISNHSESKINSIMKRRFNYIEQLKESIKSVRILNMLEVDIVGNGTLSLPNQSFDFVDAVLVGIHSSFEMTRDEMTKRIIKGLSHPKAKILAHPTSRIINQRDPVDADWEKIFKFCRQQGKAVEINAHPNRLDLDSTLIIEGKKIGVKFSLGTDSHDTETMGFMHYGVTFARKGWLTRGDILNCMDYNKLLEWLHR